MKKLFSLVLILVLSGVKFASAQVLPVDPEKNVVIYSEVVQVPGANKDLLFDRAMKVLPTMYKEVEKKITEKDKQSGKILIMTKVRTALKDSKTGEMRPDIFILYKFALNFKEGKYKYDIYDIHVDEGGFKTAIEKYQSPGYMDPKKRTDEKLIYFDTEIKKLITALKEGMKSDKVQIKEDW